MGGQQSKSMDVTKQSSLLSTSKSVSNLRGCAPSGHEARLVLMGRGEAGKSTIGKQMRLIYGPEHQRGAEGSFTTAERRFYRRAVHANAIQSLTELLHAMMRTKTDFADAQRTDDRKTFFLETQSTENDGKIDPELAALMRRLWSDAGTQRCFEAQMMGSHLNDSAAYFLNALERISQADYLPLKEDLLRTRLKKTRENVETLFTHEGISFRMIEFGCGDRKTMTSCLKTMDAMLFCVALSEYNAFGEDGESLLLASLRLFKTLVESEWFRAPVFLLLNKKDVFREKLKRVPLTVCFPEYEGGEDSFEDSVAHIRQQFEALVPAERQDGKPEHLMRTVVTSAIDTVDVLTQFRPVAQALLQKKKLDFQLISTLVAHKELKPPKKPKEKKLKDGKGR